MIDETFVNILRDAMIDNSVFFVHEHCVVNGAEIALYIEQVEGFREIFIAFLERNGYANANLEMYHPQVFEDFELTSKIPEKDVELRNMTSHFIREMLLIEILACVGMSVVVTFGICPYVFSLFGIVI